METFKAKSPEKLAESQAITVRIDKETYKQLLKLVKKDKCKNATQFTKQLIEWVVETRKHEI